MLNTRGEQSLGDLKKHTIFDWAIGWLVRENQIVITPEKRSLRVRLKHEQAKATGAL